jgi:hypothetical protein
MYRQDHDGAFPQRLSDFIPNYFDNPRSFQCGKADQSPESLPSVDAWADYLWAYWPQSTNTPADYPLAYDKRIQNHHGEGINVVTVGGGAFWDRRCEWLRGFLQRHPERRIPVPEGMNTEVGQHGVAR